MKYPSILSLVAMLFFMLIVCEWSSTEAAMEGYGLYCYWRAKDCPSDSVDGVWVTDFSTGKSIQIFGQGSGDGNMVFSNDAMFSPDGKKVAFHSGGSLYICNNDGSNLQKVLENIPAQNRESAFSWNNAGIFWVTGDDGAGTLHRYVPSTSRYTKLAIGQCVTDGGRGYYNRYFASPDGHRAFCRNPLSAMKFNEDFTSVTCNEWTPFGHGDGMTLDGNHVLHVAWWLKNGHGKLVAIPWTEAPIRSGEEYEHTVIIPPHPEGSEMYQRIIQCKNNNDWLGAQFHDDDNNNLYDKEPFNLVFNWKTLSPSDTLWAPVPQPDPEYKAIFCCFWLGALPNPHDNTPFIILDKSELIVTAQSSADIIARQVEVANTGGGTLDKVSAAISPANLGWLDISVAGTGGNSQTIDVTINAAKLPQEQSTATVAISGVGASNKAQFSVTAYKSSSIAAPSSVTAVATGDSLRDVLIKWADNSDTESGFAIERSDDNGAAWAEIVRVAANTVAYTDANRDVGVYEYRVRAYTSDGYSPYSTPAKVELSGIESITVISPKNGDVFLGGSEIIIQWQAHKSVTVIQIEMSTDGGLTYQTITKTGGISYGDAGWGSYAYTLPKKEIPDVRIKVKEYTTNLAGYSGAFTITMDPNGVQARLLPTKAKHLHISICDNAIILANAPRGAIAYVYDLQGNVLSTKRIHSANETIVLNKARQTMVVSFEIKGKALCAPKVIMFK